METTFEYKGLSSTVKLGEFIEISVPPKDYIDANFFVKITRPTVDEKHIQDRIRQNYLANMSAESLFPDEANKEFMAEVKDVIKKEKEKIENLPVPIMFIGHAIKVEHKYDETKMKIQVPIAIADYFIKNKKDLSSLLIEFDRIPYDPDYNNKIKKINKSMELFKESHPKAILNLL